MGKRVLKMKDLEKIIELVRGEGNLGKDYLFRNRFGGIWKSLEEYRDFIDLVNPNTELERSKYNSLKAIYFNGKLASIEEAISERIHDSRDYLCKKLKSIKEEFLKENGKVDFSKLNFQEHEELGKKLDKAFALQTEYQKIMGDADSVLELIKNLKEKYKRMHKRYGLTKAEKRKDFLKKAKQILTSPFSISLMLASLSPSLVSLNTQNAKVEAKPNSFFVNPPKVFDLVMKDVSKIESLERSFFNNHLVDFFEFHPMNYSLRRRNITRIFEGINLKVYRDSFLKNNGEILSNTNYKIVGDRITGEVLGIWIKDPVVKYRGKTAERWVAIHLDKHAFSSPDLSALLKDANLSAKRGLTNMFLAEEIFGVDLSKNIEEVNRYMKKFSFEDCPESVVRAITYSENFRSHPEQVKEESSKTEAVGFLPVIPQTFLHLQEKGFLNRNLKWEDVKSDLNEMSNIGAIYATLSHNEISRKIDYLIKGKYDGDVGKYTAVGFLTGHYGVMRAIESVYNISVRNKGKNFSKKKIMEDVLGDIEKIIEEMPLSKDNKRISKEYVKNFSEVHKIWKDRDFRKVRKQWYDVRGKLESYESFLDSRDSILSGMIGKIPN